MTYKIPDHILVDSLKKQIAKLIAQNLDLMNQIDKITSLSSDDLLKFKKDQEIKNLNSEILSLRQTNNRLKADNMKLIIKLNS